MLRQLKIPVKNEFAQYEQVYADTLSAGNGVLGMLVHRVKQTSGKQMRPLLLLLCARLCGGITRSSLHAAVALELLHVASLVHDDVVDEADERRGQPSMRHLFGNKVAVLGGDYLLSSALVEAVNTEHPAVVKVLANLGRQLSYGELLQLEAEKHLSFEEADYVEIIRNKTAALFTACARLGVLTSPNAEVEQELKVVRLGEIIGQCFQLRDDLFDYEPEGQVGKPTGKDLQERKVTLPLIYVYQQADEALRNRLCHALQAGEVVLLQQIAHERGGIDYAFRKMAEWQQQARESLQEFPASDARTALEQYINYMGSREK